MFINKNIKGETLIELMVAVVIGLLLISSLVEIYLSSQRGYRLQDALNHLQDNAKLATNFLKSDIQQAGYIGCARLTNDFPIASYSSSYAITPQNKLTGSDTQFTVRHLVFPNVILKTMQDASTIEVSKEINIHAGDVLIIADCNKAEIFQAESVSSSQQSQKIITTSPLQNKYEAYAEIGPFEINTYYIAKTDHTEKNGTPIYSLFVKNNDGNTELVENINHMQLTYSIYQDGKLTDVPASEVDDWSRIRGVAIDLDLVSSTLKKTWHLYVAL
ncbi:MAG: hypothetical protein EPO11_00915 [Gammaproteobacteria bacterium]|nr:MAG: hypothetical protein EPO11_00915 [Gammaproteobacteria bacterium]